MADKKISALTASTTPLAGTEVLPIVQSGATVKVSVANLTAARAVTALSATTTGGLKNISSGSDSESPTQGLFFTDAANKNVIVQLGASGGLSSFVYEAGGAGWRRVSGLLTNGNSVVDVGNVVIGTATKGIDFSANTNLPGMTSELLNWYEEGTWTPTATSQTGAITSYASGGTYTRVGRQVTVTAYVDLTNVGTAGGFLEISNFPYKNGAASGAGYLQQMGVVRETGVTGVIYAALLNGNATNGVVTSLAGGAIIWLNSYQYAISMTYYTA